MMQNTKTVVVRALATKNIYSLRSPVVDEQRTKDERPMIRAMFPSVL